MIDWPDDHIPRTNDPVYFNGMTRSSRSPYTHRASDN